MRDPAEKTARPEPEDRTGTTERPRSPLSTLPTPADRAPAQPDAEDVLHYLKTVLGFTIMRSGNTIRLRSIYAFCESDVFEIEVSNNKLVLKHTDYLGEWTEHLNTYIRTGRSYSAFFAAVTLDLFNKKTFG